MKILVLGLNYAPERVGDRSVHDRHQVTVVCGKPYYPAWKVDPAFAGGGVRRSVEDGVQVVRVPLYERWFGKSAQRG